MEPDPVDALFSDMKYIWDSLEHIFRKQMALRTLRRQTLNLSLRAVCRKLVIDFAMLVSWNIIFYMCLCFYISDFWPIVHISLFIEYLNWSTAAKMTFLSWFRVDWLDSLSVRYFGPVCKGSSFLSSGLQYFSRVTIFVPLPFSELNHSLS